MATGVPGGVNPLDFLHKLSMQRGLSAPVFKQLDEQGPAHMKTFVWTCSFNGIEAEGMGRSKKEAKVAAAKALKQQIDLEALPPAEEKKRKMPAPGGGAPFQKKKKMQDFGGQRQFGNFYQGPPQPIVPFGTPGPIVEGHSDYPQFDGFHSDVPKDKLTVGMFENMHFMPPMSYGVGGPGPIFCSRLSKLDRYVIRKHKDIYPSEAELSVILGLVRDTEESMRQVAETINKANEETPVSAEGNGQQQSETPAPAAVVGDRIKGMVRVGDLAKGLLLKESREVDVVLMCLKAPTKSLLDNVVTLLKEKLKEIAPGKLYEVVKSEEGFKVVIPPALESADDDLGYICNVTLTSVAIRKKPKVVKKEDKSAVDPDNNDKKEETKDNGDASKDDDYDVATCLPKERCLKALADLRHSRWFSSMALNLPSCVECIRIVKDLTKRDSAWAALSDWTLELLVERALFSAHVPLNPAASIMRVMEVVASGIFLDLNQGLRDPCEHEEVDVTAHLTMQQREDLTRTAQQYLRMMHFRQIHKVLGMPQELDDYNRFNATTQQTSAEDGVKTENGAQQTENGAAIVKTENGAAIIKTENGAPA